MIWNTQRAPSEGQEAYTPFILPIEFQRGLRLKLIYLELDSSNFHNTLIRKKIGAEGAEALFLFQTIQNYYRAAGWFNSHFIIKLKKLSLNNKSKQSNNNKLCGIETRAL